MMENIVADFWIYLNGKKTGRFMYALLFTNNRGQLVGVVGVIDGRMTLHFRWWGLKGQGINRYRV